MRANLFVAVVSGLLWAGVGAAFAQPWFAVGTWQTLAVGPFVGLAVARIHDWVAPRGVWGLVWLSAFTFTMAAAAFGAVTQAAAEVGLSPRGLFAGTAYGATPGVLEAIARVSFVPFLAVIGVWLTGMFVVLWPLAFVTHFVYFIASDSDSNNAAS